jgi:hypothetical protein
MYRSLPKIGHRDHQGTDYLVRNLQNHFFTQYERNKRLQQIRLRQLYQRYQSTMAAPNNSKSRSPLHSSLHDVISSRRVSERLSHTKSRATRNSNVFIGSLANMTGQVPSPSRSKSTGSLGKKIASNSDCSLRSKMTSRKKFDFFDPSAVLKNTRWSSQHPVQQNEGKTRQFSSSLTEPSTMRRIGSKPSVEFNDGLFRK